MAGRPHPTLAACFLEPQMATASPAAAIDVLGRGLVSHLTAERQAAALTALQEREKQASTFLGYETALPHARLAPGSPWLVVVGRFREGVPWGAAGEPAHLVFLTIVPSDEATAYLGFVRDLGRVLRNDAVRRGFLDAPDEPAAQGWLREHLGLA